MATTNVSVGTYASNVLAASGDIVELQFAAGASDIALVLAGTFSGTVQFEAGLANLTTGVTWTALLCNPIPSGSAASSATAVGTWQASIVGFTHFRFRCSAYASGRVYATVNAALAADGGGIISAGAAHQTAVFANAATIKGVTTGTSGQVLTSNGASTDPSYQDAAGGIDATALTILGVDATGKVAITIPNSSFDATSGAVTMSAPSGVTPLTLNGDDSGSIILGIYNDSGGNAVDIEPISEDGNAPLLAVLVSGTQIDNAGRGLTARGMDLGAFISGSDIDGDIVYALDVYANTQNSTGGNPQEISGIWIEPCDSADGFPAVIQSGIHIDDQNQNQNPASVTNAALLINNQTAGANVYAIKTGAGPVDFGDTVNSVGGYKVGGVAGISGTGTTMSNVTVVNGIITAATFT